MLGRNHRHLANSILVLVLLLAPITLVLSNDGEEEEGEGCKPITIDNDNICHYHLNGLTAKQPDKAQTIHDRCTTVLPDIRRMFLDESGATSPQQKTCSAMIFRDCCHYYARELMGLCDEYSIIPSSVRMSMDEYSSNISRPNGAAPERAIFSGSSSNSNRRTVVGYIVLTYADNFQRTKELIDRIYTDYNHYVIHLDSKASISTRMLYNDYVNEKGKNVWLVPQGRSINIRRYGVSMIHATLIGISELMVRSKGELDFITNLSESDFPIKTNEDISSKLSQYRERNIFHWFAAALSYPRYARFFVDCNTVNGRVFPYEVVLRDKDTGNKVNRTDLVVPEERMYAGSQWFSISSDFADYLLRSEKVLKFLVFYNNVFCPDEGFFQTVFFNSPYASTNMYDNQDYRASSGTWRYIRWRSGYEHPMILPEDLPYLKNNTALFARKFGDDSVKEAVITFLDERVHKEEDRKNSDSTNDNGFKNIGSTDISHRSQPGGWNYDLLDALF